MAILSKSLLQMHADKSVSFWPFSSSSVVSTLFIVLAWRHILSDWWRFSSTHSCVYQPALLSQANNARLGVIIWLKGWIVAELTHNSLKSMLEWSLCLFLLRLSVCMDWLVSLLSIHCFRFHFLTAYLGYIHMLSHVHCSSPVVWAQNSGTQNLSPHSKGIVVASKFWPYQYHHRLKWSVMLKTVLNGSSTFRTLKSLSLCSIPLHHLSRHDF